MPVVNGANGAREKIKFELGKTETVVLKFEGKGKEVQGQYGAQFMFSTTDDRMFFVDHEVAYAIEKCPGAAQGRPISITKTKGAHNAVDWDIRPAYMEANAARAIPLRDGNGNGNGHHAPPSELESKLEASIRHVSAQRAPAAPEDLLTPLMTPKAKLLAALCVAIECAVEAEVYARRMSFPLEFSSEDVRTMANTVMINAEKSR